MSREVTIKVDRPLSEYIENANDFRIPLDKGSDCGGGAHHSEEEEEG